MKIRGTALHVAEKYVTLARDAASSGDRVAEQNYLQHAEHYYRIVAAAQAQMPQPQPFQRADDNDEGDDQADRSGDRQGSFNGDGQPQAGSEQQPHMNGGEANGHDGEANEVSLEGEGETSSPAIAGENQNVRPRSRRQPRPRPPRTNDEAGEEEVLATGSDD